jgi:hypothetical protein
LLVVGGAGALADMPVNFNEPCHEPGDQGLGRKLVGRCNQEGADLLQKEAELLSPFDEDDDLQISRSVTAVSIAGALGRCKQRGIGMSSKRASDTALLQLKNMDAASKSP